MVFQRHYQMIGASSCLSNAYNFFYCWVILCERARSSHLMCSPYKVKISFSCLKCPFRCWVIFFFLNFSKQDCFLVRSSHLYNLLIQMIYKDAMFIIFFENVSHYETKYINIHHGTKETHVSELGIKSNTICNDSYLIV